MPDPRDVVEHLTVPGFIRRAPRRFHLDEITRFGDKVSRVAESFQISYLTTVDSSLGIVRLFPVPLMVKVYTVLANQFHWQPWCEPIDGDGRGPAELLRVTERARKNLQAATEGTEMPPEVATAMAVLVGWFESETRRLGAESPAPIPTPTPLRAI